MENGWGGKTIDEKEGGKSFGRGEVGRLEVPPCGFPRQKRTASMQHNIKMDLSRGIIGIIGGYN